VIVQRPRPLDERVARLRRELGGTRVVLFREQDRDRRVPVEQRAIEIEEDCPDGDHW